jgi:hypothetical protein
MSRTKSVKGRRGASEWTLELGGVLGVLEIPSVSSPTWTTTLHSGRAKRRSWGLMMRSETTLMAPERLNVETTKNVAADETCLSSNSDHRTIKNGRNTREYARG